MTWPNYMEEKGLPELAAASFRGIFCPVVEEGNCSQLGETLMSRRHKWISLGMLEKSQH